MKEIVFREYYKRLCLYAYKLTNNAELAEDVVQEAYYVLFKKDDWEGWASQEISNYLYGIVRNICFNEFRKKNVIKRYWERVEYSEKQDAIFDFNLIYVEAMNEVYRIVETMPEGCARVFKMGYLEGLKNKEIATLLGITINTVKTQKRRGMRILLNEINPEFLPLFLLLLK